MDRRHFLVAGAASAAAVALAPAARARGRTLLDGKANRRDAERVELSWASDRPALVRVSADPDAAPATMRTLQAKAKGGGASVKAPVSPRPYFLVTTADGGQVRLAERLLPLQGGRNFRDLGGYRAADGRQVKWGKLFRSGVMSGLTPADMSYLTAIGLRVICDLRSREERATRPNPFQAQGAGAPQVAAAGYAMFRLDALHNATTRDAAIEAFAQSYVEFSQALAPQYADMFDRLARGEAPLAVNCSAGKDRTGVASALILSVLGVPRETIVADYALTQVYTPMDLRAMSTQSADLGLPPEQAAAFAKMSPEVLKIMGGSDPDVMRRTLAKLDAKFAGPIQLAKARYGLTDAKIARMRQLYLV